jgi:hypothetical protein
LALTTQVGRAFGGIKVGRETMDIGQDHVPAGLSRKAPSNSFSRLMVVESAAMTSPGRAPIGIGFLNHLFLWPEPYRRTERDVKSFFVPVS